MGFIEDNKTNSLKAGILDFSFEGKEKVCKGETTASKGEAKICLFSLLEHNVV